MKKLYALFLALAMMPNTWAASDYSDYGDDAVQMSKEITQISNQIQAITSASDIKQAADSIKNARYIGQDSKTEYGRRLRAQVNKLAAKNSTFVPILEGLIRDEIERLKQWVKTLGRRKDYDTFWKLLWNDEIKSLSLSPKGRAKIEFDIAQQASYSPEQYTDTPEFIGTLFTDALKNGQLNDSDQAFAISLFAQGKTSSKSVPATSEGVLRKALQMLPTKDLNTVKRAKNLLLTVENFSLFIKQLSASDAIKQDLRKMCETTIQAIDPKILKEKTVKEEQKRVMQKLDERIPDPAGTKKVFFGGNKK